MSQAPIGWDRHCQRYRYRPRCRRCWQPVLIGYRRTKNGFYKRLLSSVQKSPLPCFRPLRRCPKRHYIGASHTLQAAEFLYETSLFPERVYTFKHALTHEVAYSSLLQERRRVLHARIVEALEALAGIG